jgi:hypothetical protein
MAVCGLSAEDGPHQPRQDRLRSDLDEAGRAVGVHALDFAHEIDRIEQLPREQFPRLARLIEDTATPWCWRRPDNCAGSNVTASSALRKRPHRVFHQSAVERTGHTQRLGREAARLARS